ncbi:MAG: TetR/AcrR family transcriptional regulator, partial [Streptococcus sp.]
MKEETDELNKKILESAKSEFLAYGYQDASLRRICR